MNRIDKATYRSKKTNHIEKGVYIETITDGVHVLYLFKTEMNKLYKKAEGTLHR